MVPFIRLLLIAAPVWSGVGAQGDEQAKDGREKGSKRATKVSAMTGKHD